MSDLVRARLKSGVETNLSPFFANLYGAEVLDEPTVNPDGSPRRDTRAGGRKVKPRVSATEAAKANKTTDATKASGSKAATTAQNEKE